MHFTTPIVATLSFLSTASARNTQRNVHARHSSNALHSRQVPNEPTGVKTLTTPQNITIRYKEPGKDGVCETTPGVNSYSGYIDLDANTHSFFWFFEARNNPQEAPITLWLVSDMTEAQLTIQLTLSFRRTGDREVIHSLGYSKVRTIIDVSLENLANEADSQELGPCNVTENLTTMVNPYSWSEVSNLLFLSQPLGTGFSYGSESNGSLSELGTFENSSFGPVDGRYPIVNATALDTTDLAAVAAWHVIQGFLGGLPQLDGEIQSKEFNLWTESYGGHYGPAVSLSNISSNWWFLRRDVDLGGNGRVYS